MKHFISSLPVVALLLILGAAVQGASAGCTDLSRFSQVHSRKFLQASSDASAVAIDNLSGQTTNQTASANAEAEAVSTSIVPLPRKFIYVNLASSAHACSLHCSAMTA